MFEPLCFSWIWDLLTTKNCWAFFFSASIYYGFFILYWVAVTSAWNILLFCFYFTLSVYDVSFQFSFLSVFGWGLAGDFRSTVEIFILNSEDFDLILSISSFEIPLFSSIDNPGKYLVLASKNNCASIFKAISCLSGIFFLFIFEGLNDGSYFKFSLILLQSFFISSTLTSDFFLSPAV